MTGVGEWLSVHSEAVVTFVGLMVTGLAWTYTRRPRPRIRLLSRGLLYLEIENIGKRIARNVELRFTPEYVPFINKDYAYGTKNLGDMDNGQRYEFDMGFASDGETLIRLRETRISVSYGRRILFWQVKSSTHLSIAGPGIVGSSADEHATPIAKIAASTEKLSKTMNTLITEVKGLKDRIYTPPPTGGEDIPFKTCTKCQWDEFAYLPHRRMDEFWCNNCDTVLRRSDGCDCPGMWCEHTPAPEQCVRRMG